MLEKRVNGQTKGVVQQLSYYTRQEGTTGLQAGVGVHFYQVYFEVLINHEVVAKHFKAVQSLVRIYLPIDSFEAIAH